MLLSLVDLHCLNAYREEPESVVIDIDDSFHETHGGQRLSLFDKFSDGHGCKPLHFCDVNANAVTAVVLRPGKTMSGVELRRHLRIMDDRLADGGAWSIPFIVFIKWSRFTSPHPGRESSNSSIFLPVSS